MELHCDQRHTNNDISDAKPLENGVADVSALLHANSLQPMELLGSGTFSNVYLCSTRTTSLCFAVKIIPKALMKCGDDNAARLRKAMESEKSILWSLRKRQHPNLLFLHYHFEDDHFFGLVLEMADMGDLDSAIKQMGTPGMTEVLSLDIFRQVSCGVNYLHSCDIIHRDLKAKNILLKSTSGGSLRAVVADFGFARSLSGGDMARTQCGTPLFMAPEVINLTSNGYNSSADVWGLGCILYCCLYGRRPFEGSNPRDLLKAIYAVRSTTGSMTLPPQPRLSLNCRTILSKALEIRPQARLDISKVEMSGLAGLVPASAVAPSSNPKVTTSGAQLQLAWIAKGTSLYHRGARVLQSYLRGSISRDTPHPPSLPGRTTTEPFVMVGGTTTTLAKREEGAEASPKAVFRKVVQIVTLADLAVQRAFRCGQGQRHLISKAAVLYMHCCEAILKPLMLQQREKKRIASSTYRTARSLFVQVLERATACCEWAQGPLSLDTEASTGLAEVIDLAQRADVINQRGRRGRNRGAIALHVA